MNKTISTSLYIGIIADTGRFLYPSTTSKTYEIVSKLVKIGVDREKVHNALNKASGFIRSKLCEKMDIRKMPEIHFVYDESIEYGKKIEDLIERINNK